MTRSPLASAIGAIPVSAIIRAAARTGAGVQAKDRTMRIVGRSISSGRGSIARAIRARGSSQGTRGARAIFSRAIRRAHDCSEMRTDGPAQPPPCPAGKARGYVAWPRYRSRWFGGTRAGPELELGRPLGQPPRPLLRRAVLPNLHRPLTMPVVRAAHGKYCAIL